MASESFCLLIVSLVPLFWEMPNTVRIAPIVRPFNPVVQVTSAGKIDTSVRSVTSVELASSAAIAHASIVRLLVPVRTTSTVRVASSAVTANASIVRLLVT